MVRGLRQFFPNFDLFIWGFSIMSPFQNDAWEHEKSFALLCPFILDLQDKKTTCLSATCGSLLKGSLVVSSRQMPTCKCPRREQQDIPGNSLGCHVFPKSGLWSQDKAACPFPALCLQLRSEGPGASAHSYSGSEPISAACLRGRERKIPGNPLKQLKGWQGTEALSIFRTASALSSPHAPSHTHPTLSIMAW